MMQGTILFNKTRAAVKDYGALAWALNMRSTILQSNQHSSVITTVVFDITAEFSGST